MTHLPWIFRFLLLASIGAALLFVAYQPDAVRLYGLAITYVAEAMGYAALLLATVGLSLEIDGWRRGWP